jgi:hypothetical protein
VVAIEDVRREHRVALRREPVGHPLDLRPQAEGVHVEQDRREGAVAFRRGQIRLGDPVGCPDVDHGAILPP